MPPSTATLLMQSLQHSSSPDTNGRSLFDSETSPSFETSHKIPANIEITHCDESYLPQFRRITSALLPIRYPDNFFTTTLTDPTCHALSRIALIAPPTPNESPKLIGAIRSRLDQLPNPSSPTKPLTEIYIQTLTLLAPYRGLGIAAAMLDEVLTTGMEMGAAAVSAHVWVGNDEALGWYERRGFARAELVENYYRRLRPTSAWVVRRKFGVPDMLKAGKKAGPKLNRTSQGMAGVSMGPQQTGQEERGATESKGQQTDSIIQGRDISQFSASSHDEHNGSNMVVEVSEPAPDSPPKEDHPVGSDEYRLSLDTADAPQSHQCSSDLSSPPEGSSATEETASARKSTSNTALENGNKVLKAEKPKPGQTSLDGWLSRKP